MPPSWVDPEWNDDDLFVLSPPELESTRRQVANTLGIRYKLMNADSPWSMTVAGINAFSLDTVTTYLTQYTELKATKPTRTAEETDATFNNRLATWKSELSSKSSLSFVVSGVQLSWQNAGGAPWNKGYISSFWQKFEDGERTWDTSVDRKIGGVMPDPATIDGTNFVGASMSSVMALVRKMVGHVKRTGEAPEPWIATAFKSLRVTWLLEASGDEIATLSMRENIEQFTRRRHTEFDNIFQVKKWMDSMAALESTAFDKTKALDIVKYALALGDPHKPFSTPEWLGRLLQGKEPSLKNKLAVIGGKGVNKRFIDDNKIKVEHPEMSSYQRIVQRVRAINGFKEWPLLYTRVIDELGKRGLAHKPCPLTSGLLLDPTGFHSDAFVIKSERENVPQWRDGAAAVDLQKSMCEVANKRMFDYGFMDGSSGKPLFPSGHCWASIARLCGSPHHHMDSALERNFGSIDTWPDAVKSFSRAVWSGEYDQDLGNLSAALPATLDSQPFAMQKRLLESFSPLTHLLHVRDTEAQRLQSDGEKAKELAAKEAKEKAPKVPEVPGVPNHNDGDITDVLCKGHDAIAKKKLVLKLNKDEEINREKALTDEFMQAAAEVLRHRLTVVDSIAAAKNFMESTAQKNKSGMRCRVAFVDISQDGKLQVKGQWSKLLNVQPGKEVQQDMASKLSGLPMTPIVGSALIRHGAQFCQFFDFDIANSMPYTSSVFVPIDLPSTYEKFLKSAARRALGPAGDSMERSGVEYQIRTIGARGSVQGSEQQEDKDENSEDEDDDFNEGVPAVSEVPEVPIEVMTPGQMKSAFGREALSIMGAMFQHQSKIGEQGKFLPQSQFVRFVKENGKSATYRKSQVDPSVVYSAIKSCLRCSATSLNPNDCFVQVCGGTPEGIVAAMVMGFQHVIFVAGSVKEMSWMKAPTKKDETMHNIRYSEFVSPNIDDPAEGSMIAGTVRMLAPYIRNFVMETPGTLVVPSPYDIVLPPLRVYTLIAVTGRVIARTVGGSDIGAESTKCMESPRSVKSLGSEPSAKKQKSLGGPGSSSGIVPPTTPKATGENDGEDEVMDVDDDEEQEGGGDDDDLAKLESLEAEFQNKTPPPKPGRSKAKGAKAKAKK